MARGTRYLPANVLQSFSALEEHTKVLVITTIKSNVVRDLRADGWTGLIMR